MLQRFLTLLFALTLCATDLAGHGGRVTVPPDKIIVGGRTFDLNPPPTPTPAAPANPAATGAATPAVPSIPSTGQVGAVGLVFGGGATTGGGVPLGPDTSTWEVWWEFNQHAFLNLRSFVFSDAPSTGESDVLTGLSPAVSQGHSYRPSEQQIRSVVIPALERALNSGNRDQVSGALMALAKIGLDPEYWVATFKPFLQEEQEIAETTALALGILQSPTAMDTLVHLLRDTPTGRKLRGRSKQVDFRTRSFAAYGLGLIGRSTPKKAVRAYIQNVLWEGLRSRKEANRDVRVACVLALSLIPVTEYEERIQAYLDLFESSETDNYVRAHLPMTIARLLQESTSAALREKVVERFTRSLRYTGDYPEIRQSCAQALGRLIRPGQIASAAAIDALVEGSMHDRHIHVRNFCVMALAFVAAEVGPSHPQIARKVLPHMLRQLDEASTLQRPWYGLALGVMGWRARVLQDEPLPNSVIDAVVHQFRKTKTALHRSAYAIALGLMKQTGRAEDLVKAMNQVKDPQFRGYCAIALGLMDAQEAREDLLDQLESARRQPELLRQTAISLGLLRDRQAVPQLLELLQPQQETPPLAVFASTASALGFIGDRRALRPLVTLLDDAEKQNLARAFAAVALGTISEKEMLPWNSPYSQGVNYYATVETLTDPVSMSGLLDIL